MRSTAEKQDDMAGLPAGVDGPAIVRPHHAQTRKLFDENTGAEIIGKKGYRNLSGVEIAYEQERLGPKDSQQARLRRDAGLKFSDAWDARQETGRDSSQALNGSRSTGGGVPLTLRQIMASEEIKKIRERMGRMDYIIIRAFCAEGMLPSEAVCLAGCDRETRVSPRVRDALDELIVALGWQARAVG